MNTTHRHLSPLSPLSLLSPQSSLGLLALITLMLSSCSPRDTQAPKSSYTTFTPVEGKVQLMNVAPGHFHAGLVQKSMYDKVDATVHVFAPEGPELDDYLARIEQYNSRAEDPTAWEEVVYAGGDFLEKMLQEKPGNLMVVSGNNARKTEYILEAVKAGIHVLSDKPMVISPEAFAMLEEAFAIAEERGVLLYDIMTERYEVTTMVQKALSHIPEIYGEQLKGSPEAPGITKESVHHFSKIVSGKPLIRPPWFFDTRQQGEAIVDVCTHLVDLVQWELYPEMTLERSDVDIHSARRWTTDMSPAQFRKVTGLEQWPEYLEGDVEDELLKVYANGEINYTLKGVYAKVAVLWNYEAPEGTGDTHYSIMRGSTASLVIRQGAEENYKPTLYIELHEDVDELAYAKQIHKHFYQHLAPKYPGIVVRDLGPRRWIVDIPDEFKVGHEAHFAQVTEKYLGFLEEGKLPSWEIPNMLVKYYTTTQGLLKALE